MSRIARRVAYHWLMAGLLLFGANLGVVRSAHGQAEATATKALGLSAFGAVSRGSTDYSNGGYGYLFGGDATRHFHWFDPSVEVRYAYGQGSAVTEKTLSGGIKVEKRLGPGGRIHPYADVMIGYGVIDFKRPAIYPTGPYKSDNSTVYSMGGGADVDLTSHFAVKGDFEYNSWKLGTEYSRLTPMAVSVGVLYRFQFRALGSRH